MALVLTIGSFDLYHSGHVDLLRRCKSLAGEGGKVIVGLNTDEFVHKYKGEPPVVTYADREDVVASSQYVFDVLPNRQDDEDGTIRPLLQAVSKHFHRRGDRITLAVGTDWSAPGKDYHAQIGIQDQHLEVLEHVDLVFLPRPKDGLSTSEIKYRVEGRNWG